MDDPFDGLEGERRQTLWNLMIEFAPLTPSAVGPRLREIQAMDADLADRLQRAMGRSPERPELRDDVDEIPRIEGYEQIEVISVNALSIVLKARSVVWSKDVAIKVSAPWIDADAAGQLIQQDALLIDLSHPHIARIVDTGSCRFGDHDLPYVATLWIDGRTLEALLDSDTHVRISAGDREDRVHRRLEWAQQACDALAYAHARGVVHYDVKPSNVMVRRGPGGDLEPVLIDFGAAQLVGRSGRDAWDPRYVSPERARYLLGGEPVSRKEQCDVFSLGAVVYEIVTGEALLGDAVRLEDALDREGYDNFLSVRLERCGDRRLRAILKSALEPRPGRRLASAEGFGAAIAAHRRGDFPVLPQPYRPTLRERLAYAWSHSRGLVLATIAIVVLLLAVSALGVTTAALGWHAVSVARRDRDVARDTGRLLELDATYGLVNAGTVLGPTLTAEDRADLLSLAPRIDDLFRNDAQRAAGFHGAAGRLLLDEGDLDEAAPHLERARALHTRLDGAADKETLRARHNLAELAAARGRHAEALEEHRAILQEREDAGQPAEDVLASQSAVGLCLQALGRPSEAAAMFRDAIAGWEDLRGAYATLRPDEECEARLEAEITNARASLVASMSQDRPVDASAIETEYRTLRPAAEETWGRTGVRRLTVETNYAIFLAQQGDLKGARNVLLETCHLLRMHVGERDPQTLLAGYTLAAVMDRLDEPEAEQEYRTVVAGQDALYGPASPDAVRTVQALVVLLRDDGRIDDAIELAQSRLRALGAARPTLPELLLRATTGQLLMLAGRVAEAVDVLEPGLARWQELESPVVPHAAVLHLRRAEAHWRSEQPESAAEALRLAWPMLTKYLPNSTQVHDARALATEMGMDLEAPR